MKPDIALAEFAGGGGTWKKLDNWFAYIGSEKLAE
jgi:hypothetical protein